MNDHLPFAAFYYSAVDVTRHRLFELFRMAPRPACACVGQQKKKRLTPALFEKKHNGRLMQTHTSARRDKTLTASEQKLWD